MEAFIARPGPGASDQNRATCHAWAIGQLSPACIRTACSHNAGAHPGLKLQTIPVEGCCGISNPLRYQVCLPDDADCLQRNPGPLPVILHPLQPVSGFWKQTNFEWPSAVGTFEYAEARLMVIRHSEQTVMLRACTSVLSSCCNQCKVCMVKSGAARVTRPAPLHFYMASCVLLAASCVSVV